MVEVWWRCDGGVVKLWWKKMEKRLNTFNYEKAKV